MNKSLFFCLLLLCWSCSPGQEKSKTENNSSLQSQAEKEVLDVEQTFNDMAADKGVSAAFLAFAAEDAVIMRGNRIIAGKTDIQSFFEGSSLDSVQLSWKPDFVRAAKSGDMAYTYGPYTFSARDTTGQLIESTGIFHTVWVRQEDGSWKFVYD